MKTLLQKIYKDQADSVYERIKDLMKRYKTDETKQPFSQKDSMIITYGDTILNKKHKPLKILNQFLQQHVKDAVSAVHLLPMFPYSSDDGFSVIDYLKINPELGDWEDINALAVTYDLMFDAVINHISKHSDWFIEYCRGNKEFENFFIPKQANVDYSNVVRPRSLPLFYEYESSSGPIELWATFSEDQLDINYKNPNVLIKVLEVLLEYAKNGASYIRFDAIGFIWKELGTSCIHLPHTHDLVKIMRKVLEACYPNTKIISETNVPHEENITYFGNGFDEAHLIYQFPLPPLTLFSFLSEDASKLTKWASDLALTKLTKETTYFNFLASHDGIGMRPTEGILTPEEKDLMVKNTLQKGGRIGYKNNPDGSKSPYELNINFLSALSEDNMSLEEQRDIFLAAQSILLSLQGIPGIYIHSLLGSENDIEGMERSQINRRINREKLELTALEQELKDNTSLRSLVMNKYLDLLRVRKEHTAFSPLASQEVLTLDHRVFSLLRTSEDERILFAVNVSKEPVHIDISTSGRDLVSGSKYSGSITLKPYEFIWIKEEDKQ